MRDTDMCEEEIEDRRNMFRALLREGVFEEARALYDDAKRRGLNLNYIGHQVLTELWYQGRKEEARDLVYRFADESWPNWLVNFGIEHK